MVLSSFHCFDDHFAFEVVPFVLVVVPGVSANQYAVKLSFLLDGLLQIAPTSRCIILYLQKAWSYSVLALTASPMRKS